MSTRPSIRGIIVSLIDENVFIQGLHIPSSVAKLTILKKTMTDK